MVSASGSYPDFLQGWTVTGELRKKTLPSLVPFSHGICSRDRDETKTQNVHGPDDSTSGDVDSLQIHL